ncbi:putative holin-like toxin [Lactobacillus amylovorus]|uniref:putative holin-like toxin n=1 Tax=Lactobacillus amylovorus TaxID=1604 RepID=UPI003A5D0130
MSVSDTLQLMISFGSFVVLLITLVVELIKIHNQRKKIAALALQSWQLFINT